MVVPIIVAVCCVAVSRLQAMKYPADLESQRKEDLERLEREKDETQLAEELEEMEDDGDGDL